MAGSPRVLVFSERNVIARKWHALQYEFEDVGADAGIVDIVAPRAQTRGPAERLLYRVRRDSAPVGTREVDVEPVPITGDYDLFYAFFAFPSDIPHVRRLLGWRKRCAKAFCFIGEQYSHETFNRPYLEVLRELGFDKVFVMNPTPIDWIQDVVGCPVEHMGHGVDALRFNPYPDPPERVVDLYQYGRRSAVTHEAALRLAREDGRFYVYDTVFNVPLEDWRAHRTLVAETMKRTKYFFAYTVGEDKAGAMDDDPISSRYYEAMGGGAILLGSAPSVPQFKTEFPWEDAVIAIPYAADDLREILAGLEADPVRLALSRRNNLLASFRRLDWAHTWARILQEAGLPQPPGLEQRLRRLAELAEVTEAEEDRRLAALS